MKKNIGMTDRIVRVMIFVVLVALYFTNIIQGTLGMVLLVIAAISLITSIVGFCGLYTVLGITTCPLKKKIN